MNLIIFILFFCFFVFLYVLYYLSHDDFVIVRKDIQMERVFNMAFLTSFAALFISRFVFVLSNTNPWAYLNPLVFAAFPYFPGLSLPGGLIGGSFFIYFYANYKKMPIGKMFDLFVMSFIAVLPLGFIGVFIIFFGKADLFFNLMFIYSLIILLAFAKVIYHYSIKNEIKDGSLGLMFGAIFSLLYFLTKMFIHIKTFSFFDPENFLLLISLFVSLILLVNREIMDKFLIKK